MEQLHELCRRTGYAVVDTPPGIVKVISTEVAAPYIEGELSDVLHRLIRLARKTYQ